jgi:hypothetical protein
MRYEGDIPTLLLGSDASTLSEDPNAAVAGAWLVIGVFTARELQSKDMEKWRERIKWKNRVAYGGAKMCWGTKADRTIMARERLAILLATSHEIDEESERGRDIRRYEDHPTGRQ